MAAQPQAAAQLKKVLYHGEFREMGPVKVTVLSEPTESTKQKGTYYVKLMVQGRERHMHPENGQCLEFWRGQKGFTMSVVAEGTHDEARFTFVGEAMAAEPAPKGKPAAAPATQRQSGFPPPRPPAAGAAMAPPATAKPQAAQGKPASPPAAKGPPPAKPTADREESERHALNAAKRHIARNRVLGKLALMATMKTANEFEDKFKKKVPDVVLASFFASCLFGTNGAGVHTNLPLDVDLEHLQPSHPPSSSSTSTGK